MTEEQKRKSKFRNSAKWKKFKKYMQKKSGNVDAITGRKLRAGWQLHHLDLNPEHYEILNEDNFICLNKKTHDMIHFLFRYRNYEELLENLKTNLDKMENINNVNFTFNEKDD